MIRFFRRILGTQKAKNNGGGGVTVHNDLDGRAAPDTHPASAIGTTSGDTVQEAIDNIIAEPDLNIGDNDLSTPDGEMRTLTLSDRSGLDIKQVDSTGQKVLSRTRIAQNGRHISSTNNSLNEEPATQHATSEIYEGGASLRRNVSNSVENQYISFFHSDDLYRIEAQKGNIQDQDFTHLEFTKDGIKVGFNQLITSLSPIGYSMGSEGYTFNYLVDHDNGQFTTIEPFSFTKTGGVVMGAFKGVNSELPVGLTYRNLVADTSTGRVYAQTPSTEEVPLVSWQELGTTNPADKTSGAWYDGKVIVGQDAPIENEQHCVVAEPDNTGKAFAVSKSDPFSDIDYMNLYQYTGIGQSKAFVKQGSFSNIFGNNVFRLLQEDGSPGLQLSSAIGASYANFMKGNITIGAEIAATAGIDNYKNTRLRTLGTQQPGDLNLTVDANGYVNASQNISNQVGVLKATYAGSPGIGLSGFSSGVEQLFDITSTPGILSIAEYPDAATVPGHAAMFDSARVTAGTTVQGRLIENPIVNQYHAWRVTYDFSDKTNGSTIGAFFKIRNPVSGFESVIMRVLPSGATSGSDTLLFQTVADNNSIVGNGGYILACETSENTNVVIQIQSITRTSLAIKNT